MCKKYNSAGGGELKFIEDVHGRRFAIDWNPRFPAWIFGASCVGVNMPAALIQHAMHASGRGKLGFPEEDRAAVRHAIGGFSRTVIEIPMVNIHQGAFSMVADSLSGGAKGKGSCGKPAPIPMLPPQGEISARPSPRRRSCPTRSTAASS